MSKVGVVGLVCGIIGFVIVTVTALIGFVLLAQSPIDGTEIVYMLNDAQNILEIAGIGFGVLGLILGIVGAVKHEKKAPCIMGILFGSVALIIASLNLVIFSSIVIINP